jgi:hypothetical protein
MAPRVCHTGTVELHIVFDEVGHGIFDSVINTSVPPIRIDLQPKFFVFIAKPVIEASCDCLVDPVHGQLREEVHMGS